MSAEPADLIPELLEVAGRDVLDVGCGEGWLVRRLTIDGARATGVDPLGVAIACAVRERPPGSPARYVEAAAQALPFPDASFDIVIFLNSLHHVELTAMDGALAESARVLRAGGLLYVQEPLARGSAFELLRPIDDETAVRAAALDALRRAADGGPFTLVTEREVAMTVTFADLAAVRARTVSVDPTRAPVFDRLEPRLRDAFERLGRPVDGGRAFDQPFRATLLAAR